MDFNFPANQKGFRILKRVTSGNLRPLKVAVVPTFVAMLVGTTFTLSILNVQRKSTSGSWVVSLEQLQWYMP